MCVSLRVFVVLELELRHGMNSGDKWCHVASDPKWLNCNCSHQDASQWLMCDQLNNCNRLVLKHFCAQLLMYRLIFRDDWSTDYLNRVQMTWTKSMNKNIAVQLYVVCLSLIRYSNAESVNNYTHIFYNAKFKWVFFFMVCWLVWVLFLSFGLLFFFWHWLILQITMILIQIICFS